MSIKHNKDYYKKQSSDKLTQSAIDGMVKDLKIHIQNI